MADHPSVAVANPIDDDLWLRRNVIAAAGLIAVTTIFIKVALVLGWSASLLITGLIAGYAGVSALSPPMAAAFLIVSAQLLAQVSMTHAGTSAFGVGSVIVLMAISVVRWRQGWLEVLLNLRRSQYLPWILLAFVFAIGFIRTLQAPAEGSNSLHYVFVSHWLVYMGVGLLACTRLAELKIFFVAFSGLYLLAIYPLPLSFYPRFFESIYVDCVAMGLHNMGEVGEFPGSVNRSQVAYLAATASLISLSFALHRSGWRGGVFFVWAMLAAVVVLLAGSKGAVLSWSLGLLLVGRYADRQQRRHVLVASLAIASVIGLSVLSGYSPIPCGTMRHYVEGTSSYDTRRILLEQGLHSLGEPQVASEPQIASESIGQAEVPHNSVWLSALLGSGWGASAKAINPETGKPLAVAGSHNLLIDILVDTGVLGTVLFCLALALLGVQFVRAVLKSDVRDRKLIQSAVGGMLIVTITLLLLTTSTYREYLGAFVIGLIFGFTIYRERLTFSQRAPARGAVDMSGG